MGDGEIAKLQEKECGPDGLTESESMKLRSLSSCHTSLLFQQECYWRQRARINWLSCGDANTNSSLDRSQIGSIQLRMILGMKRISWKTFMKLLLPTFFNIGV